jgi:hypothetical protein
MMAMGVDRRAVASSRQKRLLERMFGVAKMFGSLKMKSQTRWKN